MIQFVFDKTDFIYQHHPSTATLQSNLIPIEEELMFKDEHELAKQVIAKIKLMQATITPNF